MRGVVARKRSTKKVFLKITQNSQKNTFARVSNTVKGLQAVRFATL